MRLKNKISGEIKEFVLFDGDELQGGTTLESLTKEWEDASEEPKEYYAIDLQGDIIRWARHSWDEKTTNKIKEIGNYFETKEEAEKAVAKLKAWKRLKDKGFEFTGFEETDRGCLGDFTIYCYTRPYDDVEKDLDLLFGGEE